jgi:hypothetical protein
VAKPTPLRSRLGNILIPQSRDREGAVVSDFCHKLLILLGHKRLWLLDIAAQSVSM